MMLSPIYTEKTRCQDCYKCVRQCPVKAIQVNDGSAVVRHDLCIFCGRCIEVCPVNAKKLRSDTARAKQMIELNSQVWVSLAPSFPAEFQASKSAVISALKRLGFSGVSETSVGARIISDRISARMKKGDKKIISSACPTVKELIRKYQPDLVPYLSDLVSPLHAHADYLKKDFGESIKVVFIGPCISKKLEADDENNPVDLALTFLELKNWLQEEKIMLIEPAEEEFFYPEGRGNAAEFAIEGGMLNTIKKNVTTVDAGFISFSGITNIRDTFQDIADIAENENVFLEYLACDGGCISGKGMTSKGSYLKRRLDVLNYHQNCSNKVENCFDKITDLLVIEQKITAEPIANSRHSEKNIIEVLSSLEKFSAEDEINCSGCGYNSCRDFAAAVFDGKAEKSMCVTHMRKIAEKKSNALMKALPLGVVITDSRKKILECNQKFITSFSDIDLEMTEKMERQIAGLDLDTFIPDTGLFTRIQTSENSMLEGKLQYKKKVFRMFVFRIGQEKMIGAIFQDITSPAVRRETIIRKTEEVIEKNLKSVQQIASLLGENAAETQLILNSLIETYYQAPDGENR
ncbi:MAG: 4Fe-4S binding protein [Spirochaetales bacterium]|nr:4Fe-4S binding protein [Spirochaetales bacterium]